MAFHTYQTIKTFYAQCAILCVLSLFSSFFSSVMAQIETAQVAIPQKTEMPERADAEGVQEVWRAIRDQLASAVVRIETMGGAERVENIPAIRETTGVIISKDGYLVASAVAFAHEPDAVAVVLSDGIHRVAKIVCTDLARKITLLKINVSAPADISEILKNVTLPEATSIQETHVGQKVVALGRVLNAEVPSVATGILSGKNRQRGMAIQTDAHVSPDNYGGPLVTLDGTVLGILTPFGMGENELMSGLDLYDSGTGFAIPLEDILARLPRLKAEAERGVNVLRPAPKLGVLLGNPAPILASTEVLHVATGTPAEKAGILAGDLITHADGIPVHRGIELLAVVAQHYEGETIILTINRKNTTQEVSVLLKNEAETSLK